MGLPLNTVPVVTQSSGTNGQVWKPRKSIEWTCPSGQKVIVKRPGPETLFKISRVVRGFARKAGLKDQEVQASLNKDIADMTDEELAVNVLISNELLVAMIESPKLVLNPRPGFNEIGPSDIDILDYDFLTKRAKDDFFGLTVSVVKEKDDEGEADTTEVTVSDLDSFREQPSVRGDSVDSAHLSSEAEPVSGDQGLVGSTEP